MSNFLHTLALIGSLNALFVLAPVADAAVIAGDRLLIDLGQKNTVNDSGYESGGSGTTATDGNYWNNFAREGGTDVLRRDDSATTTVTIVSDLVRASDGNATGASLEIMKPGDADDFFISVGIGGADNENAADTNDLPLSAARDTFFFNDNDDTKSAIFEFRDLDTSLTYNLSIFGSVPSGNGRPLTEITVGGVTRSYDPEGNGDAGTGTTTADFADLVPEANGTLTFVVTKDGGNAGHINTIDLTVVPEPTSFVLLLAGGCLTLSRRSRRNRLS